MRISLLSAPCALLVLTAVSAPAQAVVTVNPGGSITGDAANDVITVSCAGGQLTASGISAGESCAAVSVITVDPFGGADQVNLSAVTAASFPALRLVDVDLTEGGLSEADTLTGSAIDDRVEGDYLDTVFGGPGNDHFVGGAQVHGGPGEDTFMQADSAYGDEGDDRFVQFTAPGGIIDGGAGLDSWELDFDQEIMDLGSATSFTMTASALVVDIADDPGPALNFPATNIDRMFVTLIRQGAQSYDGSAFPGSHVVRGMPGPDNIAGGAFDDALFGGADNDTLTGGGGADVLQGGLGNDVIQARDGVVDRVDCGEGTDSVVGDHNDVLVGCETADLTAAPVTPPPPPPPALPAAPETSAISGPSKVKKPKKVSFKYSSTTAGATFECRLDSAGWKPCGSSYKVNSKRLKRGKHKLWVRAVSGDRHDTTPSLKKFKVV